MSTNNQTLCDFCDFRKITRKHYSNQRFIQNVRMCEKFWKFFSPLFIFQSKNRSKKNHTIRKSLIKFKVYKFETWNHMPTQSNKNAQNSKNVCWGRVSTVLITTFSPMAPTHQNGAPIAKRKTPPTLSNRSQAT